MEYAGILTGYAVSVVEDDDHLAQGAAQAPRKAGGNGMGPVGDEAEALA